MWFLFYKYKKVVITIAVYSSSLIFGILVCLPFQCCHLQALIKMVHSALFDSKIVKGATTFSTITFSSKTLSMTRLCYEYHHAKSHNEFCILFIVVQNVVTLNAVKLSVVALFWIYSGLRHQSNEMQCDLALPGFVRLPIYAKQGKSLFFNRTCKPTFNPEKKLKT
jgi:hypothetical protein